MNGVALTDAGWQVGIPEVPAGYYLWTRTITTYQNGDFSIAYVVGYTGEDGAQGTPGVSITDQKEQWYLSTSSSSPTGGSWSYIEPQEIPDGKYLWGRLEFTMSDGTTQYSTAVHRSIISGLVNIADTLNKKITQKVWQTDISNSLDYYDSSTAQSIRDRVSQTETDISGITSTVSDVQTTLATKADGSTVTALSNTVTQNKQTADAFQQTVTSTYAKLTDVDSKIGQIKVGGYNLYIIADETPGFVPLGQGAIQSPNATYKERTSDYIPVKPGEQYVIQSWCTPNAAGESWLAYKFLKNDSGTQLANRVDKYGRTSGSGVETTADGQEHLMYKVTVPENAQYIRVSYRQFEDGYAMIEKANTPSEYAINPKDLQGYTDDVVASAKSEIKQTTDAIELSVSSKVGNDEVISKINQSAENITISASKVDLVGQVAFNMLDTSTQNTINTASTTANTALNGIKAFTGTSSTATGTAAKVVSCSDTSFALTNGVTITVTFSTANTADAPTLNVNSKGAKAIYFDNAVTSSSNKFRWQAGSVITFQYNGTYWVVINYENLEYFTSSTAAGTAAKVNATVTGTFVLCRGTTINVYFSTANSATSALTLNIGSTGAYTIYYKNAATSSSNQYLWAAGTTVTFTFNGSYWYVNDGGAQLVKDYAKPAVDWTSTNGATVVTAADIMKTWTEDATLATTTISGGYIKTHTIESDHLATDAIMSSNYTAISNSHFSSVGTFLDLANGNFYTPNFGVSASNGEQGAYINGDVVATSGKIGSNSTNYWEIGNKYDFNAVERGAIIGHGSSYIQAGNWQLSNDKLNTQSYASSQSSTGVLQYYKDSGTNTFYDVGVKLPTDFSTTAPSNLAQRFAKSFFYGRKYTGETAPSIDGNWTYFYLLDTSGNMYIAGDSIVGGDVNVTGEIYEGGTKLSEKYAAITDVGSAYLPKTGGTINGNLTVTGSMTVNGQVTTTLSIKTNLASTSSATISGSANATITPGVSGTLGVGNGGTGATTFTSGAVLIGNGANAIQTRSIRNNISAGALGWTSSATDTTLITTNTLAYWDGRYQTTNNNSNIQYVKLGKIGTVVTHDYDEFITTLGGAIDGALSVVDLTAGDLVVTGVGRFTNGLYGDLTGNADTATTATQVGHSLKIQLNSGTSEGSNQFTFNGSATKTVNITKTSIGLGNVENTALSTWAGSSNLTTVKVGTLAAAATKGVDTTIANGSTSANLPTSSAVASYVEGKGYVTSSGVTSITLAAGTGISLSATGAITTTGTRTITNTGVISISESTTNGKISVNTGGTSADVAIHGLAALAYKASLGKSDVGLGNVTNNAQVKGLSSGTTNGHLVTWGADGYTVADSGVTKSDLISGVQISGSTLTITKADGTSTSTDITITASQASGATILTNAQGVALGVGDASHPTYFAGGIPVQGNVIPTITLNGSATTSPSFYAPTTAGTENYALLSNGSGAPKWSAVVRGVKGNSESSYRTGQVNLTAANIGAVNKAGDTMTGALVLPSNKWYESNSAYAINAANSDIINVNSIYTGDTSDATSEGINFYRDATHWDTLRIYSGKIYFSPNRPNNETATDTYEVYYKPGSGNGSTDIGIRPMVDCARANHFAFLPPDQVIIEKTTDGGTTWVSAEISDDVKRKVFQSNNKDYNLKIPLLNGAKSTQCGIRVTITAMKYNVPSGTPETQKYNYWNSNYVQTTERYSKLQLFWFWVYTASDRIRVQVESASGANSTNWANRFNKDFRMAGSPGSNWVEVSDMTFGGALNQTSQGWNWRFTFWTALNPGSETFTNASQQSICAINGYGDNVWTGSNNLMKNDHIYSWDVDQNTTFPAQVTATKFNGEATSATKFSSARSVTLTGDTTGTVSSDGTSGWSVATITNKLTSTGRKTSLDVDNSTNEYKNKVTYMYAASITTTGKPPTDACVLNFAWDNNKWSAQLAIHNAGSPEMYIRGHNNSDWDSTWKTILDSGNYNTYAPKKDGTGATGTWGISISGNATTASSATKATQDGDGAVISSTYAKLSGATFTGAVSGTTFSGTSLSATTYISANSGNSATTGGLALYSTSPSQYGITMRQPASSGFGTHGYVQGNWAIYNCMAGVSADESKTRGWIYRNYTTNENVTSISADGNVVTNGSITIGGNEGNTSGVELVVNPATNSLDFVWR